MKLFTKSVVFGFAISSLALSAAPPLVFNNRATIDYLTNLNAVTINNYGVIEFLPTNAPNNFIGTVLPLYDTFNTANFNNAINGIIEAEPGFAFKRIAGTSVGPLTSFVNSGIVLGFDVVPGPRAESPPGLTTTIQDIRESKPFGSGITINSASVLNSGSLSVGDAGLIKITGKTVNLSYGSLAAGSVDSSDATASSINATAPYQYNEAEVPALMPLYVVDPERTYDLAWGLTNGLSSSVVGIVGSDGAGTWRVNPPLPPSTNRAAGLITTFSDTGLTAFVYRDDIDPTNIYYNVVFVRANPAPNVTVSVAFGGQGFARGPRLLNQGDPLGRPALVTFSEPVVDVITGSTVTNSIYFEDDGAAMNPFAFAQNAQYAAAYGKPDIFEASTAVPPTVSQFRFAANAALDPGMIFTPGIMSDTVSYTNAVWAIQIGRDPEDVNGQFPQFTGSFPLPDVPDVTNEAARIEIHANSLNMSHTRFRAEGLLTIQATNFTGVPNGTDWGVANVGLTAPGGSITLANFVPASFNRLRGGIFAWSGNWVNLQTNATITNIIHTHISMVDPFLQGSFAPTFRQFALNANKAVIKDNVRIVQGMSLNTPNLTIDGGSLSNAQTSANVPLKALAALRNLLITNGGTWEADGALDIGFDSTHVLPSPVGRAYVLNSISNYGSIISAAPTLVAATVENDGLVEATSVGSALLAANSLGLGARAPSSIFAGGSVTLSANSIEATNSTIVAATLSLQAPSELHDFPIGFPDPGPANPAFPTFNFWFLGNGVSLPYTPNLGDLHGTEIWVRANGSSAPSVVTWAVPDDGPLAFVNHEVIGRLVLDRTVDGAVIVLQGTAASQAIYVNYLDLEDSSFTDYKDNLIIDPRLTVYFQGANIPFDKLTNAFPQFVYAPYTAAAAEFAKRALGQAVVSSGDVLSLRRPPATGVYNGLFAGTNGITRTNSGFLTFALAKNGAISGRVLHGSASIPFATKLSSTGEASFTAGKMAVWLWVDSAGNFFGSVNGVGWDAVASGSLSWTANRPSMSAGAYTLMLPDCSGQGGPAQRSVGSVKLTGSGTITAAGKLADGSSFSQSTQLSKDGQWPFFAFAPGGSDVLLGWLNFADEGSLAGDVVWMKPAQPGGKYPGAFSVTVPAVGVGAANAAAVQGSGVAGK